MNKQIFFLVMLLIVLCKSVNAIEITSAPSNVEHNTSIVLSGTSFGTKSTAAPLSYYNFEDGLKPSNWTYEFSSTQSNSISIVDSVNGVSTKCAEFNIYQYGNSNFSWINGAGSIGEMYIYYKIKKNFTWSSSGDDAWGKVKCNRVVSGTGAVPNCYYEFSKGDGGLKRVIENATSGTQYINWTIDSSFSSDTWHIQETFYKFSSIASGVMQFIFNGVPINNKTSLDFDVTSMYGFGIGLARVRSANMLATDRYWLDDIYIDNTQSKVFIGDQPTFVSSTKREIQIPTEWSDTEITITVNTGTFQEGATSYLYVIDSNGNVSNGFQVTIGEDNQPTVVNAIIYGLSDNQLNNGEYITVQGEGFQPIQGTGRVLIGNSNDYNTITKSQLQDITSWEESSINFQVNKGTFNDGELAYLYVINDSGYITLPVTVVFASNSSGGTVDINPSVSSLTGNMAVEGNPYINNQ